ncbi:MAG: sulfotransferase family protein [Spirochaetaceae bacterium]|nr:sulfotransferase family protein [Spirochaetaceae bacterium]MCF7949352.1 sulfotransferase family protein [Spirochaetia bacterium]
MDIRRRLRKLYGKLYDPFDYNSHIFAFHEYKAIYMAVPKAANTSMKTALTNLMPIDIQNSLNETLPVRELYAIHRNELFKRKIRLMKHQVKRYNDYFVFTIVRNPWDRLVSCYADLIRSSSKVEDDTINSRENLPLFKHGMGFRAQMPFDEFVEAVVSTPDRRSNRHFRSQYTFLTDGKGRLLPQFIGHFSNLQDDFEKIKQQVNVHDLQLPHVRRSSRSDYREYYNNYLRKLVETRYEKDIALFNFSF